VVASHPRGPFGRTPPDAVSKTVAVVLGSPAKERHPINILQSTPTGVDAQAVNLLDLTGFVEGLR
jgi:hypothetical protein